MPRRIELSLVTLVLFVAAGLRLARLGDLPPGWRDDEVVETTVHAARVLAGDWPLYFAEAEGHEPLYHYLSAGWIALAGRSLLAVRLVSTFLALLSLAALYRLARRLFGAPTALLACALLAVSFWGLMYARFKLRHIGVLLPMLLAFDLLFRALGARPVRQATGLAALAGVGLAAALYTYYAARVLPVILLAFGAYLALARPRGRRWPPALSALGVCLLAAGVLAVPLAVASQAAPGGEARLGVVGQPLRELLQGRPAYALETTLRTLGMFAFTGDPEFLYNIPNRPVFGPVPAALLAVGVAVCLRRWRQPGFAFLLLWLVGGLAPAFFSTPAASLGHTIVALPAAYLLPAIGLAALGRGLPYLTPRPPSLQGRGSHKRKLAFLPLLPLEGGEGGSGDEGGKFVLSLHLAAAILLVALVAARDLPAYFVTWPALPQVRALYRADLHAAGPALRALAPGSALGLTSPNLHPADVLAVALEAPRRGLQPRAFNPERAWPFPGQSTPVLVLAGAPAAPAFAWHLPPLTGPAALLPASAAAMPEPCNALAAAFANGLTVTGYCLTLPQVAGPVQLLTYWRAEAGYAAPPPRPVAVLAGTPLPLKAFSHVLAPDGSYLAGDDRLDVDPATLQPGDTFVQAFEIPLPAGVPAGRYPVQIGLYDPASGERVLQASGDDRALLAELTLGP